MRLLAELEPVCEAHDVEAGVHRGDVDAQLLRQPQVRPAQLVHVDLEDVAEVDEHVRGSLRAAGDVHARRDHVRGLATSCQVPGGVRIDRGIFGSG